MILNPVLCPRCGGAMQYRGTLYSDGKLCCIYRCRDCGYVSKYCAETRYSFSG